MNSTHDQSTPDEQKPKKKPKSHHSNSPVKAAPAAAATAAAAPQEATAYTATLPPATPAPFPPQAYPSAAPAPQHTGLPVWGIVLIIVGVLLVLGTIAVVGLALIGFAMKNQLSSNDKRLQTQPSTSTQATSVYKTTRAEFSYPSTWQKRDIDPTTIINGNGSTVYQASHFTYNNELAADYREYASGKTPYTTPISYDKRLAAMRTATETIASMTESEGIATVESYGLGCVKDYAIASGVDVIEKNGAVGVKYDYFCIGSNGERTLNTRMQWYDGNGNINLLTVSTIESSWRKHSSTIKSVFDSVKSL